MSSSQPQPSNDIESSATATHAPKPRRHHHHHHHHKTVHNVDSEHESSSTPPPDRERSNTVTTLSDLTQRTSVDLPPESTPEASLAKLKRRASESTILPQQSFETSSTNFKDVVRYNT